MTVISNWISDHATLQSYYNIYYDILQAPICASVVFWHMQQVGGGNVLASYVSKCSQFANPQMPGKCVFMYGCVALSAQTF